MKTRNLGYISLILIVNAFIPDTYLSAQTKLSFMRGQSNSHRIQLTNTPLIDALAMIEEQSGRRIFLDSVAIESHAIDLSSPITMKASRKSCNELIDDLLPSNLTRINRDRSIFITLKRKAGRIPTRDDSYISIRRLAMRNALDKVVPVHFDHMPLSMAVEFLAGFAGLNTELQLSEREKFETLVSIHKNNSKLSTCLSEILSECEMTYEIRNKKIVVRKSKTPKRTLL